MNAAEAGHFVLQVAVVLLAAYVFGRIFSKWLKQPSVMGELVAGIVIGPHALGGVRLLGLAPLFERPSGGDLAVPNELHAIAVLASAVLLFLAGLETDVRTFLRYSVPGLVIALGGAVLSFILGDAAAVWTGFAQDVFDPSALFMGVVATATSVGLTARVLTDKRKMDTAEGATILSAAVIDDVIGLTFLAVVLGLKSAGASGSGIAWGRIGWVGAKAVAFWVATTACGVLFARRLGAVLTALGGGRAAAVIALGMAFLLAALAEKAGLALIIGAYTMGLSFSQLDRVYEIQDRLRPVHDLLVPIFFCVAGMMVDIRTLPRFLGVGLVFTAMCVIGKTVGCGAPALLVGFNRRGAARIGVGMMPRQEVALIVAAVGMSAGTIGTALFGAVIVMTFLTTFATPPVLAAIFDDRPGLRRPEQVPPRASESFRVRLPSPQVAEVVAGRMAEAFRQEQFFTHYRSDLGSYEMRKEASVVFMDVEDDVLTFRTSPDMLDYTRLVVSEALIGLHKVFQQAGEFGEKDEVRRLLLGEDIA